MKTLLVMPPSPTNVKKYLEVNVPPLSLPYLAAMIDDVKIVDALSLDYSFDDLRKGIEKYNPDLVGITGTTPMIYDMYEVAKIAKEVNPNSITVVGGPHVTFTAERTLKECKYIDVVVRGEGEKTFQEIWEGKKLQNIKGITFRHGKDIVSTPSRPFLNVDEIPFPRYDLLPLDKYKYGRKRFITMVTSRGCPFGCIFCSSSRLYGKLWRGRSAENVVAEMKMLHEKYGLNDFEFIDDTFTLNKKRVLKICDLMNKEKLNFNWNCSTRADTIDKETARIMKKAGCQIVYMGAESGSQQILDFINKKITINQIKKAVDIIKSSGLEITTSFVLGMLGETKATINKTINFAKKLKVDLAQFTLCTPYPGTPLWEIVKKRGLLLTENFRRYTTLLPVMRLPTVTGRELKKLLEKAYRTFYLNPAFLLKRFVKGDFPFLRRAIKATINYIKDSLATKGEDFNET